MNKHHEKNTLSPWRRGFLALVLEQRSRWHKPTAIGKAPAAEKNEVPRRSNVPPLEKPARGVLCAEPNDSSPFETLEVLLAWEMFPEILGKVPETCDVK